MDLFKAGLKASLRGPVNGNVFKDFTTSIKGIEKGWLAGYIAISVNNLGLVIILLVLFLKLESQINFWPNSSDAGKAGQGMNLAPCILSPDVLENFTCNCYN